MNSVLKTAYSKLSQHTATRLTEELRNHASENGWHPHVVANMHVAYEGGEYKVKVHPDYKDRAFVHEYGDENQKPTATIRKFSEKANIKGIVGEVIK